MSKPKTVTCISCSSKDCERTSEGTFDICRYGISFIKRNGEVEVKEPKVPLSTIAKNLRHEINPILQFIIQQTTIIDPNLSTKYIHTDEPLSLIIGSTVILDNFIQMITGVHEFHSTPKSIPTKKINLYNSIYYWYNIYSILKEEGRTKYLKLKNTVPPNIICTDCSDLIKYMLAILIDNAWKYSVDNTTLTISVDKLYDNNYNLKFTNKSRIIPEDINIFEFGVKVDDNTKGFGYGLHWIKTLEHNYNNVVYKLHENGLLITHKQIRTEEKGIAIQEFIIYNIKLETE